MPSTPDASRRAAWLVAIIVFLAAAFAVLAYTLNPAALGVDALRFGAIALTGLLVVRGIRWARLLLVVLTGLAAAFAVLTAISVSMAPQWKLVFLLYGVGTIACLWALFRPPASAHFLPSAEAPKGGA
jgi:phage-related protein